MNLLAIKTGKLQDISPQEVLDCSQVEPYENYGCDGGSLEPAYDYIKSKGPIAVGMDASSENWQFYGGGIYYEPDCKSAIENLNHAVTLVGYGEENGMKYWIVKNSYGTSWGENGYAKIARNETNHCGIASYAVYPLF
ncbi:hypothetical protein PPYR_05123 [Photinus pyralis]|uniref:Peptidase C1A papain C-terminal domain-containing protein n=1 Tax=Photinus pyralis TaxID=7054 RepID=A0A5N4B008_PHOPY|nr:hypothetical protein PPYR_05123 [Photinus pyralis]